ncbi:Histidine-containing phosphotransfer 4 -like protein [Gossypium arboreum]|uniref:Histidine-containing phosphotransfer protein n=1 Tax=Gossypium arboreum TaxID=29729 RepID=A0A0B0PTF2_GOSAR|nr:pseudo histidine-containing phosphotransfer protein 2-like isoform X3 [Gossypium arboreum]KHG28275.1 Histidine-containing phosphotransfer 4 -like protein [Gossypium arboreum]
MESKHVNQQIAAMRQSFFDEEVLDEFFSQLEQLEDQNNPNFVEEVFTMYFRDSTTLLETVEQAIVGANKVLNEINKTRQVLEKGNLEGTKAGIWEMRKKYGSLKAKLEPYFQLKQANSVPQEK